jgi:hypothetical protein
VQASTGADASDGFLSSPSDRTSGLANDSETTPLAARASRRPDHHASATQPSRSSDHAVPGTRFGYTYALRIDTSFPSLPTCARMRRGPSPQQVAITDERKRTLPGLCPGTRPPAHGVTHRGTLRYCTAPDFGGETPGQTCARLVLQPVPLNSVPGNYTVNAAETRKPV